MQAEAHGALGHPCVRRDIQSSASTRACHRHHERLEHGFASDVHELPQTLRRHLTHRLEYQSSPHTHTFEVDA